MAAAKLCFHVPVDEFTIVQGPGPKTCDVLFEHSDEPVTLKLTLMTSASNAKFRRKVIVTSIERDAPGKRFVFHGLLEGRTICGEYYYAAPRTGILYLDD